VNRVELRGGVTTEPKIEFLPSGDPVVTFTVAVNGTRWSSQENKQVVKTAYIRCRAYSDIAKDVLEHADGFDKGDEVYVLGELDQIEIVHADGKKDRKTGVTAPRPGRRAARPPGSCTPN
jgi:single-strand DNA-binding protein